MINKINYYKEIFTDKKNQLQLMNIKINLKVNLEHYISFKYTYFKK